MHFLVHGLIFVLNLFCILTGSISFPNCPFTTKNVPWIWTPSNCLQLHATAKHDWPLSVYPGDSGYKRFTLGNCISNLSQITLQWTTLRTSVSESLQLHFNNDAFVEILLPMFSGYYIRKMMVDIACSFFDTCKCDLFQRCIISVGSSLVVLRN